MPPAGSQPAPALPRRDAVRATLRLDMMPLRWRSSGGVVLAEYGVAAAASVYAWWAGWPAYQCLLILLIVAMVPPLVVCMAPWSADLAYRLPRLHVVLPLRPEDLLRARYVLLLVHLGVALLLGCAAVTAVYGATTVGWGVGLLVCVMGVGAFAALPPVFIRFNGVERAMGAWGLILFGVMVVTMLPAVTVMRWWSPEALRGAALPGLTVLVVLLSVAGLYASWRLSLRLYQRREL